MVHSREPSIEKVLQPVGLIALAPGAQPPPTAIITSPHQLQHQHQLHASASRSNIAGVIERAFDPKSASYGHHRQTSIVHGIQHSRNGSLASASSSPLSPQMIAAAGAGLQVSAPDRSDLPPLPRYEGDVLPSSRPPTALSGTTATSSTPVVPERTSSATDASVHAANQRKLERIHSGKMRRDHHGHNHSHSSKHPKDKDSQSVGEYVLHVLFTTVRSAPPDFLTTSLLTIRALS